jgi:hypothetical protein
MNQSDALMRAKGSIAFSLSFTAHRPLTFLFLFSQE